MKKVSVNLWLISVAVLMGTCLTSGAEAAVSMKNGNFFVGYTDIIYPGGFEPKIERTYNSKSAFHGIFGWGWGNEHEVYLTISADGSVIVHEYGGGSENRFNPVAFNAKELEKAVDAIAEVAKQNGAMGTTEHVAAYKKKLKEDAWFRNSEWEKFRNQGKLQARQLPNGTQLHSNQYSYQYVTKVAEGFVRNFDNGRIEKFDNTGKLSRVQDKNGNFIDLARGTDGKIVKLQDNFNRKMFFTYGTDGHVSKINGENGKEATYEYNSLGELVKTKDVDNNTYTFKYSQDKRHNMTEIGYADKTTMTVAYHGRDKHENVKQVKDRDDSVTEYNYSGDVADKDHVLVSTKIKAKDGKAISSSEYEYFLKHKADGAEWTYKMVSVLDGERTETVYNECCGLPLIIKRGNEETSFEYDAKGHVTKKITPTEITELAYDAKVSKVAKVTRYSKNKKTKKQTSWSSFQYDDKGNLLFAKNSYGKGVKLFYDANGRIKSMVDQNRKRIDFKYNENSKPVEITDPSLGTIKVTYANSGEIKKVDSSAGRKIALQVTSAFQNLLDIIRPAGVTLAF